MGKGLCNRGFASLLSAQFLGAANDNILKGVLSYMLVRGIWSGQLGSGGQAVALLLFTLPFIFLSGYAGKYCDRHSKKHVSVLMKVYEIPIVAIAMLGFWTGSLWLTMLALVLLAAQSAVFGPAKYGMIPELVDREELSPTTGFLNMFTNMAIIMGGLAAGLMSDRYAPPAGTSIDPLPWLPGMCMIGIACAGLASILFLPSLHPGDSKVRYDWNPLSTYLVSLKQMAQTPLLMVLFAWSFFYLLVGMALLILPEYTIVLSITDTRASFLLGFMAVGIGLGSVSAGLISGRRIRPELVIVGGCGLAISFLLLGLVSPTYGNVSVFISMAGFFAGFYLIPLQALMQDLAPENARGRYLGTSNGMNFAFLGLGSIMFWLIRPLFNGVAEGSRDMPEKIFLCCGGLMIAAGVYVLPRLKPLMQRSMGKWNDESDHDHDHDQP